MSEVLKKFGRYFLLDQLAQGGMAEIYRARLASTDGAGRLLVIKKIQGGFGANTEFQQMFKSEIKVTMGFSHPNIAQLYDFGEEDEQPYIAMELVDGRNLRQFTARFNEIKQTFPVELGIYIIEQAASGLHYAHSFRDKISGDALNIVHRDISPQNILISYEGNVKVIDFGIAKATTNSEMTRAGVIKGKPSYLSPEQISGEVLDGRSDIFALGAVLWEVLTGRKLFAGENDLAILKLIESSQTHVKPPSTLNPKVPKELDYIVLKSLTKQREKRYQTAEEFQRALHKFLYSFMPEFNPSDLAYYAKDLFKTEIVEDRKKIQKLNDKVEHLLAAAPSPSIRNNSYGSDDDSDEITAVDAERKGSSKKGGRAKRQEPLDLQLTKDSAGVEIEAAPAVPTGTLKPTASPAGVIRSRTTGLYAPSTGPGSTRTTGTIDSRAPQQRRPVTQQKDGWGLNKMIGLGIGALLLLSVFGSEIGIKVPFLSNLMSEWIGGNEAKLVLEGNQSGVTILVNGQKMADSLPTTLSGIPVGTAFHLSVSGPSGSFQQDITLRKGEKRVLPITLTSTPIVGSSSPGSLVPATAAALGDKGILLKLQIFPAGGSTIVTLNGQPLDPTNPNFAVALDSPLELSVDRPGFKSFKREFVLESSQLKGLKEWPMDVSLEPLHFGYLTIHTTPSADATVVIDGTPWKKKTPVEKERFPIGTYSLRLTNDVLGMEKTISVSIQEGKSVNIDERLEIKN